MPKTASDSAPQSPLAAVEAAVALLEQLALGEAFAAPFAAAAASIAELRARAVAALFPAEIAPAAGDAYAALAFHAGRFPGGAGYGVAMSALHGRTLRSFPALAALVRTVEVRGDVGAAAAAQAQAVGRSASDVAAEAVAAFDFLVARQLVEAGHELAPAGRALVAAEDLAGRLAAARQRHQEHAQVELARAEAERLAAERARAEEAGRRAVEAAAEAQRLEQEAGQAREHARRLAAERFAERLRGSRLKRLEAGDEVFSIEQLVHVCSGLSQEQLARLGAALDRAEAR